MDALKAVSDDTASSGLQNASEYLLGVTIPGDINKPDEHGWTALHRAARAGDVEAVSALIHLGADIHARCEESKWSVLHAAAYAGSAEAVELLIQRGADVEAKDEDGATALHFAADNSSAEAAKVLLRAGANVNAIDEGGWSTLFYAASGGSLELLKLLVERGQEPIALAKDGRTALHVACTNGKREAAEWLVALGVDVNSGDENGRTPLHSATLGVGDECLSFLLSVGAKASVNAADRWGNRPLHFAASKHRTRQTQELLQEGAHVHALTNNGDSPLQLAVFTTESNAASATVAALCSFGAQWTPQCHAKLTAMKASVETGGTDARTERSQHLHWCSGFQACVLHWEKQHREGDTELLKVPREVIERGEASVKRHLLPE